MTNKPFLQGKKAVTFDLDGTLVNTVPIWNDAMYLVAQNLGLQWQGFGEMLGYPLTDVWDNFLFYSDAGIKLPLKDLVAQTQQKFLEILNDYDLDVRDGFWQLACELKEERGMKLGLVTNSSKAIVQAVLPLLGISATFDLVVTSEDIKSPKPSPESYIYAAKMLGVLPTEILAFEDSPAGAISARKAKADVVVIWDSDVSEFSYPEDIITYVGDFSSVLNNLDLDFNAAMKEFINSGAEKASSAENSSAAPETKKD